MREGGPQAGVEAWLGGRADGPELERARAAHAGVLRRLRRPGELAGHPPRAARARRAAVVLTGPWSPPHIVAAADALAALLPAARRAGDGDLVAAARSLLASP